MQLGVCPSVCSGLRSKYGTNTECSDTQCLFQCLFLKSLPWGQILHKHSDAQCLSQCLLCKALTLHNVLRFSSLTRGQQSQRWQPEKEKLEEIQESHWTKYYGRDKHWLSRVKRPAGRFDNFTEQYLFQKPLTLKGSGSPLKIYKYYLIIILNDRESICTAHLCRVDLLDFNTNGSLSELWGSSSSCEKLLEWSSSEISSSGIEVRIWPEL